MASLLSPPESKRLDSFSSPATHALTRTPQSSFASDKPLTSTDKKQSQLGGERDAYASPPISPCHRPQNNTEVQEMVSSDKDPQLFRHADSAVGLSPNYPLFPEEGDRESVSPEVDAVVSQHMSRHRSTDTSLRPTRSEYILAVSCVPKVVAAYKQDPIGWLRRERDLLFNYYGKKNKVQKAAYRRIAPAPSSSLVTRKQKLGPNLAARPARIQRTPPVKRTPPARVYDSFDVFATPSPKPARAPTNRDDVDYQALEDFAPPLSTLPKGNSKVLKADWKGQMLDLSADPDRHMLHEAEVNLAATLRLSCATYLCSKRRIFIARIEALRIGKEFRKTDAQQACKIDVNKASKLWSAYDRIGWFKREYFDQYV